MADIVELILTDHQRIMLMQAALRDVTRSGADGGSGQMLARVWERLACLIEVHADAEEEICCPTMFGTAPAALAPMEDVAADLDDIRELVSEARLLPVGSPAWWQAVKNAFSACVEHFDRLERGVLADFGRQADGSLRQRLGGQWAAFTRARLADYLSRAQHDGAACQLCTRPISGSHRHVLDTTLCAVFCACAFCYEVSTVLRMARPKAPPSSWAPKP